MQEKDLLMQTFIKSRDAFGNTYNTQLQENENTKVIAAEYFGLLAYRPCMLSEVDRWYFENDFLINIFYTQPLDASGRFDPGGVERCTLYFSDRAIAFEQSADAIDKHEKFIKVGKYLPEEYGSLIYTIAGIYRRQYPVITKEEIGNLWD